MVADAFLESIKWSMTVCLTSRLLHMCSRLRLPAVLVFLCSENLAVC